MGDSDLEAAVEEPVSEVKGEYFLCNTECLVTVDAIHWKMIEFLH